MEISEEEDKMMYMYYSKKQIDKFIHDKQYHAAFNLLILVLGRLDNTTK